MQFSNVVLAGIGVTVPPIRLTSDELEHQLDPLYRRLKLPQGRLELMSGIRSRRLWHPGTVPSEPSIESSRAVMEAAGFNGVDVGALIHASVCRDFLEPATASRVHHELGISQNAWVYDVSNACLGVLNGAVQIATMIESGMISAGIVVGSENSRPLTEATVRMLNEDPSIKRRSVKPAFASLTIGSGSCAWLLCHRRLRPNATPIQHAVCRANTRHHDLCRSDQDTAGAAMQPLMETDSETLMAEGIATGVACLGELLSQTGWSRDAVDRTVCHQVGIRHQASMLEAMGLSVENDAATFPVLGNTGSVALPISVAAAVTLGRLAAGHQTAMLGIGSGINSVMIGTRWGDTVIAGNWAGLLDEFEKATTSGHVPAPHLRQHSAVATN
ncbi:MAG: 3-oxoacyl-ACP synthase III [Planctomycetota bacterium]